MMSFLVKGVEQTKHLSEGTSFKAWVDKTQPHGQRRLNGADPTSMYVIGQIHGEISQSFVLLPLQALCFTFSVYAGLGVNETSFTFLMEVM